MPIDTRVSPSLHSVNVQKIGGYDDDGIRPFLVETETAFSTAYEGVAAVWNAREKAEKNPGWTPEQRTMQVSKFSDAKFAQIAKAFDSARATLTKQIAYFEEELSKPVSDGGRQAVSAEIRAHVKGLSETERTPFIQQAIASKDTVTMNALLGAPAYLSGVTGEMQNIYLRLYRERLEPELSGKLKATQAAKSLIEERAGLVFTELQNAVGAPAREIAALRRTHEEALKALEIQI